MEAFFAQVAEGFDKLGRDLSAAVDKVGADYNRSASAAQRAETAGKTGIVSERATPRSARGRRPTSRSPTRRASST